DVVIAERFGSSMTWRPYLGSSSIHVGARSRSDGRHVATTSWPCSPSASTAASRNARKSPPAQWTSSQSSTWGTGPARTSLADSRGGNGAAGAVGAVSGASDETGHRTASDSDATTAALADASPALVDRSEMNELESDRCVASNPAAARAAPRSCATG